jgi:serine/threonine-protein kinase RsbW
MPANPPTPGIAPLLEERLDDLYEHAPCGYVSAVPDGTIVKVNQTFLDWTGYAREELVGARRFQDLLTRGGQIYHETHYAPLLRMQGFVHAVALQVRRADGSRLHVLVNSVLRQAQDGGQAVVRTTVFDASDRHAYEQELLEARRRESAARRRVEDLQRLTETLAGTLDEDAVAAATLDAAMQLDAVRAARIEVAEPDADRPREAGRRGEPPTAWTDEMPLTATDRPLGRLQVAMAGPGVAEDERAFLHACAHQCALALERALLRVETARAARRGAVLAELARGLEETRSSDARARWLVSVLVRELADEARIEMTDERGERTVVSAGTAGEDADAVELPLPVREQPLGALLTVRRARPFGHTEREFLREVAARAALALENARLYEHEHQVADALQRSMLTAPLPEGEQFRVAAHYQPSVELMSVGGDWYDAFEVAEGRLALVVGDVVGRGIEAASAMGQLRSATRALAPGADGPGALLEQLDEFVEHVEIARYATLVYAELDLAGGRLRFACAGHPPPVLSSPGGHGELLWEGRSPPLGAFPDMGERTDDAVQLEPGARLFMYTDGLVERRDRPIDQGLAALLDALREHGGAELPALVAQLPEVLVRGDEMRDDICVLGLAFGPPRP